MEEFFDVCDENGIPTGEIISRKKAHETGVCHRTAHVWVIRNVSDGDAEILLQKRSDEKDSFPGCYDTSAAGHVMAGDTPEKSAERELYEELGIKTNPGELKYIGFFRNKYEMTFRDRLFRDNEISNVYIYDGKVDAENLRLQTEEVSAVKWFGLKYVCGQKQIHNRQFCVPMTGLKVLMNYLGIEYNNDGGCG